MQKRSSGKEETQLWRLKVEDLTALREKDQLFDIWELRHFLGSASYLKFFYTGDSKQKATKGNYINSAIT